MLWSGEPTLNLTIYIQREAASSTTMHVFLKPYYREGRVSTIEGKTTMQKHVQHCSPVENWLMFIIVVLCSHFSGKKLKKKTIAIFPGLITTKEVGGKLLSDRNHCSHGRKLRNRKYAMKPLKMGS